MYVRIVCKDIHKGSPYSLWSCLAIASYEPFVGGYLFEGHGAACVELLCADAYFGSEAELASVSEAGWGVVIDAGGVNFG